MRTVNRRDVAVVLDKALDHAKDRMRNALTDEDELRWAREIIRIEQDIENLRRLERTT